MADGRRIAQVLTNLVNNAVKYSPPDTAIDVVLSGQGKMVQWDISDQGLGIPVEDRLNVFEAFRQLGDTNNSTKMKGAGLGLAICKALIEAHEGRIWIADREPPGTTVSFTLPIAG
jgi:signal transduction histidine kinase